MKPSELYTSEIANLEKKLSGHRSQDIPDKYADMPKELVQAKIEFLVRRATQLLQERKLKN